MQIGAVYPQIELRGDPSAVRLLGLAVEELGFDYLLAYDHVLGAVHANRTPQLTGPYTEHDPFHDPFVMFAYLAAITERLQFATGILILPQRQTALVARQAADLDLLSGGRLRLGVGIGWNHVEYEALGMEWKTRGARQGEQVEVLRRLWTQDLASFDGRFHKFKEVSILPQPVQRPIPIWFGGSSDAAVTRAARLGDGWMPIMTPDAKGEQTLAGLREKLKSFGRDPAQFGIEGWLRMYENDPQHWAAAADGWRRLGADMVMLYPMYRVGGTDAQIEMLRRFKEAVGG
jgi:probable F420-dependent oxidoreductase